MLTPVVWSVQLVLLTAPVGSSSLLTNVALRKPAVQSSNSQIHPAGTADKGVDGNYNTNAYSNFCQHTGDLGDTASHSFAWWMVDLQGFYEITSVKITNRGDCCGDRLRNLDVQVFTVSPLTNMAARVRLCRHYDGPMAAGGTELLQCHQPITGRYLRVRMINSGVPLHMCEVEVLGKRPDSVYSLFTISLGRKAEGKLLREVTSPYAMACVSLCASDVACSAVNLGPRTLTSAGWTRACQLLSFGGIGQPDSASPHPDWHFYSMADV